MANNYTLKDLIKDSIYVYPGTIAVWPQNNNEQEINFDYATFNGSYASNNGTLCFVIENGRAYVTPETRRAKEALSGMTEKDFYVPFSNGDVPKYEQLKWSCLKDTQKILIKEDFIQECIEFCNKNSISELNEDSLSRCFVMPEGGVNVKHMYFEDTYFPVINTNCFDCTVSDRLGKYSNNNGRVVFVNRDGRTLVTKGYWILEELRSAGYVESNFFVPFSNGEEILDPVLRKRWEDIKK